MAHLTLAGVSEDGKRLLLVDDSGAEFSLEIDSRLRAALGGDHARLGQLEITMESTLRPRDIQARIRAGESPEAVAQAAHTTLERIMPFAAPVLAERQHVAERAQRSSVRRRGGEGGSSGAARTLGDAVASHLRSRNVDPATVSWDAWRREDGRWSLTGQYDAAGRSGVARFTYDAPGSYVLAEDDDARWLLGDLDEQTGAGAIGGPDDDAASPRPVATPADDLTRARERRLSAVQAEELPLGDDAIGLVREAPAAEQERPGALGAEQPVEAYLDDEPATREQPAVEPDPADAEEQPRRARRKGRASVPSWDEIMFGSGGSDRG